MHLNEWDLAGSRDRKLSIMVFGSSTSLRRDFSESNVPKTPSRISMATGERAVKGCMNGSTNKFDHIIKCSLFLFDYV